MNARSKGEKRLYRETFGFYLFGDRNYFNAQTRFSLEPLRESQEDSLVCSDIEGMEWVRLQEIRFAHGGEYEEIEIRKAADIFAAMERRGELFPQRAQITHASFEIRFSNSNTARKVTISSENKAQFKHDDDVEILEEWMKRRGFISFKEEEAYEMELLAMAMS